MKAFMAEDNICAQSLLRLVSHGNAVVAEILRLKDHLPDVFLFQSKEIQQKYQEIVMDFSYFKVSDNQEKKIASNSKLQDLDDDLKEKYLELVTRFYLLFENIYQYVIDLNAFVEQLNGNVFIQQNIDTILKDVEGKQLLCESLYLYGAMLLLVDLYMPGGARERLLVAFYRYSTSQSQSNVDEVCKLLRDSGYDQQHAKRPADYPVELFGRVNINQDFVERVIGKLRSEDVYNQLAVYTAPEHRAAALAPQASMLVVCLFFTPHHLQADTTKMREIADKFFPSNWIISVYMGVNLNVLDYWEHFKAAKTALNNTCNSKMVKEVFSKRGDAVTVLTEKTHQLLKEGMLTDDFVLDNINKILNLIINSNFVIRWLLLHNSPITFFESYKKSKQMRDQCQKDSNYDPLKLLELLISTAELELKVREILNRLVDKRDESWNSNKAAALEAVNSLSELFSGVKPVNRIPQNDQLKLWFEKISKQISALGPVSPKAMKRMTQIIQALDEVEDFHGIKSTGAIVQYLTESKEALRGALRAAALKEESLVTLETVADVSYAWRVADTFTPHLQASIQERPAVASRLRALFLKLASAMEIPLLRINQARSDDLVSVSQYYSSELIKYIQKVLQIIPEMVFAIVEKIIELQTWSIKELPTRLDKDRLRDFAQLEQRMEVARLTHSASTFTTGILDMRSTLVGVIRVDPAELLEEGLEKELARHLTKKFEELLEPVSRRGGGGGLGPRLQQLAEGAAGYRRSLEYIQDYINMHGLKIWQKQISAIINESVSKEISARKGVALYSPSAGFMGSLARQLAALVDARTTTYVNIGSAWYDTKTQNEVVNTKTFSKLNEAIGVVGLHGLDTLYAFMIKNQLQTFVQQYRAHHEKLAMSKVDVSDANQLKEIDQITTKVAKVYQQLADIIVTIGTLQILRKHISYQLNTVGKFDSAHLEASLSTMNESLLNLLRHMTEAQKSKVTTEVLHNLEGYLTRCGIYEPYEKIYMKNMNEIQNTDSHTILALLLISQGHRMQICSTTGDIITKRSGENIDGYPLLIGVYTVLVQTCNSVDAFVDFLCNYVKSAILNKSKAPESGQETSYIVRILELFCEIFKYPFAKLEDKLPTAVLSHITLK